MIYYKSEEEIDLVRESSLLVAKTHAEIARHIKPGISSLKLDVIAEEFIRDNGGEPAFKGYNGFPCTLCASPNEVVVHGIPNNYPIDDGTILSIDCGVLMNGFYGDSAYTYEVGEINEEVKMLLKVTKEALYKGIENAVAGKRIGDIGSAVQEHAENSNYGVVREMIGHGIGKSLHEEPQVPNYGPPKQGHEIKEGLCLAIEPMINLGNEEIKTDDDGWTIRTLDGKLSAHFEHTIAVTAGGPLVLSKAKA